MQSGEMEVHREQAAAQRRPLLHFPAMVSRPNIVSYCFNEMKTPVVKYRETRSDIFLLTMFINL